MFLLASRSPYLQKWKNPATVRPDRVINALWESWVPKSTSRCVPTPAGDVDRQDILEPIVLECQSFFVADVGWCPWKGSCLSRRRNERKRCMWCSSESRRIVEEPRSSTSRNRKRPAKQVKRLRSPTSERKRKSTEKAAKKLKNIRLCTRCHCCEKAKHRRGH